MRYGIPQLGRRVAPRIASAEAILLLTVRNQRIISQDKVPLATENWIDLPALLAPFNLDILVCGGIDRASKQDLARNSIEIIDNVACDIKELFHALETDSLCPGYGFKSATEVEQKNPRTSPKIAEQGVLANIDCLACRKRHCLLGRPCPAMETLSLPEMDSSVRAMLDAAADIYLEEERTLCRVSELVYFCIEMKYRKIGVAFCAELLEPAEILTRLLRRYFEVIPVICKAGGVFMRDPFSDKAETNGKKKGELTSCNPLGQAEILNSLDTHLNVMVGLCMGVDCVFTKASQAPVTTLFVKDKSLANNPIGALYSDYYLKEVTQAPVKALQDTG